MPATETMIAFLIALTLLELSPGPDMMMVMARGIGQGRRVALFTTVGMVFVAGFIQVSLLVLGLATVVHAFPVALDILRWAGAAYLIHMGVRMLRTSGAAGMRQSGQFRISDMRAIRDGAINSLTNPKSLLFMFAFLPQFVDPSRGPVWLQLLLLGTIQKLTGILSLGGVALASGAAGKWMSRHPGFLIWQERFTGVVMITLGLRLLVSGGSTSSATH